MLGQYSDGWDTKMTKNLNTRVEIPGFASKSMNLIVSDASEEDVQEIVDELDALLRQGVRELRHQGHKISIG